jgi:hypothetical protein
MLSGESFCRQVSDAMRIHLPLESSKLSRVLIIAFGEQQRRQNSN